MKRIPDFRQSQYAGWNTISDIFHDPMILESLDEYREFDESVKTLTEGDLIEMIFSDEDRLQDFLRILRENAVFSTQDFPKMITLILALNFIEDNIRNMTPDVIHIFSEKVYYLVSDARETVYGETDETQDEPFNLHEGLTKLLEKHGFPCITTDGEIVYYHSLYPKNDDIINVYHPKLGVMTMDRDGNIISERDDADIVTKKEVKFGVFEGGRKGENRGDQPTAKAGIIGAGGTVVSHKSFNKKRRRKADKK